jgi:hypothetical protein
LRGSELKVRGGSVKRLKECDAPCELLLSELDRPPPLSLVLQGDGEVEQGHESRVWIYLDDPRSDSRSCQVGLEAKTETMSKSERAPPIMKMTLWAAIGGVRAGVVLRKALADQPFAPSLA